MTNTIRRTSREVAMDRLMGQPTISVYDAMAVLRAGEVTVRRAIAGGEIASLRIGRRIYVLSAPLRKQLGIED